ncbi:unnamed protein product, partial [marine sediment metagenome]
ADVLINLVPGALAITEGQRTKAEFESAKTKNGRTVTEVRNRNGDLVRERDIGPAEGGNIFEKLGLGRHEMSERIPLTLSMPSIQGTLEQQAMKRMRTASKDEQLQDLRLINEFVDITRGDTTDPQRLVDIIQELADRGLAMPDPSRPAAAAILAESIERKYRMLVKEADNPDVIKEYQKYDRQVQAFERRSN